MNHLTLGRFIVFGLFVSIFVGLMAGWIYGSVLTLLAVTFIVFFCLQILYVGFLALMVFFSGRKGVSRSRRRDEKVPFLPVKSIDL